MKNKYEIRGDVVAIVLKSKKNGDMETLISTKRLERAKEFPMTWYPHWEVSTETFYVRGNYPDANGKQKTINLHRWITSAPTEMEVDHFNHKTLDNTDDNLRVITPAENQQNMIGASKNSKSGVLGVCFEKRNNKWRAQIKLNGRVKHIGYYITIEEAGMAYREAKAKYHPYSQEVAKQVGG